MSSVSNTDRPVDRAAVYCQGWKMLPSIVSSYVDKIQWECLIQKQNSIKSSKQCALQQVYFIHSAILMTLLPMLDFCQNQRVRVVYNTWNKNLVYSRQQVCLKRSTWTVQWHYDWCNCIYVLQINVDLRRLVRSQLSQTPSMGIKFCPWNIITI